MDNGGKRALIPIENKRQFLDVNPDILERSIRFSTAIFVRLRTRPWGLIDQSINTFPSANLPLTFNDIDRKLSFCSLGSCFDFLIIFYQPRLL